MNNSYYNLITFNNGKTLTHNNGKESNIKNDTWKEESFTSPDVTDKNIICLFKSSNRKNKDKTNKYLIVSSYFLNKQLILDERNSIILADLLKKFEFNYNISIIIVRKDVGQSNLGIGNYFWRDSNIGVTVNILTSKDFFKLEHDNIKHIDNNRSKNRIVIFQDFTWFEILFEFKFKNIIVSGGDVVRRHSLSYNSLVLAQFITLLDLMKNYYIDNYGFVLHKTNKNFDDSKLINNSQHKYNTSYLDFRDERFKEIMRSQIDFTHERLQTQMDIFKEYLKNKEEFLKYKAEKKTLEENNNKLEIKKDNSLYKNSRSDTVSDIRTISKGFKGRREYHQSAISRNNHPNQIFTYLDTIESIIKNKNLKSREAQSYIENSWVDLIKNKLNDPNFINHRLVKAIKYTYETVTLINYSKRIKSHIPLLEDSIDKIECLMITFSLVITYHTRLGYTAISSIVGNHILYSFYKNELNIARKKYYKLNNIAYNDKIDIEKYFKYYDQFKKDYNINERILILLGDHFITCFIISDVFIRDFNQNESDTAIIKINPDYLEDIKQNIIINPSSLPMICEPEKWSDISFGGFLENKYQRKDIVSSSSAHKHKIEDRQSLYTAINYLNSIQFGINKDLLNFLLTDGKYLLEVEVLESQGEIIQREITLNLAQIFANIPFYLNIHADWRGRLYTHSFFISYQGSDLSSSLLQLWVGEKLTEKGREYLYIYGANLYNENKINKKPYKERILWVKDNYDNIINMIPSFMMKAENKFIFAAFCLTMKNLHEDPKAKVYISIFLDATCSGIQHFAALLKDLDLGSKVNLIPQKDTDNVGDIYSEIMDDVNKAVNEFGDKNPEFYSLSKVKLTREIVKTSIMTKVYNVSVFGITLQLKDKLKTIKKGNNTFYCFPGLNGSINLTSKELYKIAQIIYNQIFILFPSLKNIYNYFIDIAKLMIKLEIPLSWITPAGLKITQHYLKSKKNKISISIAGKSKTLVLKEMEDTIDSRKQNQAIIPNIIHSLDATHLIKLINTIVSINFGPILTIHDCFGTHPNLCHILELLVKKEFILLYIKEDFLKKFHTKIIESIKDNQVPILKDENDNYFITLHHKNKDEKLKIPTLPSLGSLDIKSITYSKYMIT